MLAHKEKKEDKFVEQAMQLRARFEVDAPETLFLSNAEQNKVPINVMPLLV